MLHTMYFADAIRAFGEIDKGESATLKDGELGLALRLIEDLSHEEFKPDEYRDDYRQRVLDLVNLKVEGKEVTTVTPEVHRAQVIDLMDASSRAWPSARALAPRSPSGRARRRRHPRSLP